LNVHSVNDVRQTEIHTAEPLVSEPSALRLSWLLKTYKVTNHRILIKAQQNEIKAAGRTIRYKIHKFIILF